MMKNKRIKIIVSVFLFFSFEKNMSIYFPINLIQGFDPNVFPVKKEGERVQFSFLGASCFSIRGQNRLGEIVNPLQTIDTTQNALAMLKGFAPTTEQAQLGQLININDDDGIRGHFSVTGDVEIPFYGSLIIRSYFNHGFWIGAELPLISAKIKNVIWTDLTQHITLDDALTHRYITDDFTNTVARLGNGLILGDWQNTGISDIIVVGGWEGSFLQEKEWLKKVTVGAWIGTLFPTGYKANPAYSLSFNFGTGGAFGIPFGADLALRFKERFWIGVDAIFLTFFNHSLLTRVYTDVAQTDLLLLQLAKVRIELGFFQKFNLFFEPLIYKGFSLRFAYEHIKLGQTKQHILSDDFNNQDANAAFIDDQQTINEFVLQAKFCFDKGPQAVIFGKMTTSGKQSLRAPLIGMQLTLDF